MSGVVCMRLSDSLVSYHSPKKSMSVFCSVSFFQVMGNCSASLMIASASRMSTGISNQKVSLSVGSISEKSFPSDVKSTFPLLI